MQTPQGEEFVGLFSLNSRRIYAFISTLVVRGDEADEVFQNTSLVLWKKFETYSSGTSFWAWACKIAYYEALKIRTQKGRQPILSDEAMRIVSSEMLENESTAAIRQSALIDCMDRLDGTDRELIDLRYYRDRAPKTIAELQSRSVHSVYRALSRVHDRLMRCVQTSVSSEGC